MHNKHYLLDIPLYLQLILHLLYVLNFGGKKIELEGSGIRWSPEGKSVALGGSSLRASGKAASKAIQTAPIGIEYIKDLEKHGVQVWSIPEEQN